MVIKPFWIKGRPDYTLNAYTINAGEPRTPIRGDNLQPLGQAHNINRAV